MLITESIYLGERLICKRKDLWHNEGTARIFHTAYCCPTCGTIWGRRIVSPAETKWKFYERSCESHGDGSFVFSEQEWHNMLLPDRHEDDARTHPEFYPIEWMAYELFLIIRRDYPQ